MRNEQEQPGKPSLITIINDYPYFMLHRRHVAQAALRDYAVTVFCPLSEGQGGEGSPGMQEGLTFSALPLVADRIAPVQDMGAVLAAFRLFRERKPEVIHAITVKAIIVAGLAYRLTYALTPVPRRPRLVVTFPGLGRGLSGAYSPLRQKLVDALLRLALSGGKTALTFETQADQALLESRVRPKVQSSTVVNGTGVNFSLFKPPETVREGALRLLFAGRLLRSKGVLAFAAAAKLAKQKHGAGRFEFLIAGWPYAAPDCLTEAEIAALKASPDLTFLGMMKDMPRLLADVDGIILPSHYPEGIPRILIEAAACEIVPVATDFAGARCVIIPDETGILLAKPDAEAILAVSEVIAARGDRGRGLGAAARRHVIATGMSEEAVQGTFLKLFRGE